MSEIMNGKPDDANPKDMKQASGNVNDEDVGVSSFENEFNSTFTKLEAMQEEIVEKKIAELERELLELETFALKIINEKP